MFFKSGLHFPTKIRFLCFAQFMYIDMFFFTIRIFEFLSILKQNIPSQIVAPKEISNFGISAISDGDGGKARMVTKLTLSCLKVFAVCFTFFTE